MQILQFSRAAAVWQLDTLEQTDAPVKYSLFLKNKDMSATWEL